MRAAFLLCFFVTLLMSSASRGQPGEPKEEAPPTSQPTVEVNPTSQPMVEVNPTSQPTVLSPGEPKVQPKKPTIFWGYKSGFFVKTADERFKLKLAGWAHVMWTGLITDGDYTAWSKKDDQCAKKNDLRDNEFSTNEFSLRRARLLVKATAFEYLHAFVLLELMSELPVLDYYATFQPFDAFGLRVGQFKAPLSRHFMSVPWKRTFISSAMAMTKFKLGRDIGVNVLGSFRDHLFEYQAGVFNGSGMNAPQDNTDFLVVGRMAVNPLGPVPLIESDFGRTEKPLLSIGFSGAYNPIDKLSTDYKACKTAMLHTQQMTLGGDITFIYKGLVATGEVYYRSLWPEAKDRKDALGFLLHAGYFIWPKRMELAVRTSMARLDMDVEGKDMWEFSTVLNTFIYKTQFGVQAEYSFRLDQQPGMDDRKSHGIRVQMLFRF